MHKLYTLWYIQNESHTQTLMLYRNRKKNDISQGKRNGVWGKIEIWESPDQCIIREIKEETWLDVLDMSIKGIITAPNFDWSGDDFVIFVYRIDRWTGELIDCLEWELHWIDNDQILQLNTWEWDKVFIPLVYQSGVFSIYQNYQNWYYLWGDLKHYQ